MQLGNCKLSVNYKNNLYQQFFYQVHDGGWSYLISSANGYRVEPGYSLSIFHLVTKYVYQYYATKEGLYYMLGRDWQTAAIPVTTTVVILILKQFVLRRDERNVCLINLSVYSGLLYLMTCQHFLFQRFGMMFFTTVILTVPELFASIGVQSVQTEPLESARNLKSYRNKSERKKAFQEKRKRKTSLNMHKYIYYYALLALVFVGFLYNVWILLANRINLVPYLTFLNK